MEYRKIISVTGLSGLFELVNTKKDGAIVRGLEDKITRFVPERIHGFSNLEAIEVYTVRDNVNLAEVLLAMQASNEPLPAEKDAAAVKAYFQKVYPDMDFDRVYASDMKKMVKWFAILKASNVEIKVPENEDLQAADESVTEPVEEPKAVEKTEKKTTAKKSAKEPTAETTEEKKPAAKKAAPKKKAE